jgi:hypothetical protein
MTNKELLEFAAKAAGLEVVTPTMLKYGQWNPLTDDGDALRLAVKLGLDVCIDTQLEDDPSTHVVGFPDNTARTIDDVVHHNGDPYAATRRAITRAAAEIGKTK